MSVREPRVSIIGGGLSAVYAYWGCLDAGIAPQNIEVFVTEFSITSGAVFMYESPIPWEPIELYNILLGTCEMYAEKQHGDSSVRTSAHKRFDEGRQNFKVESLFDTHELLPTLWGLIPNKRESYPFSEEDIHRLARDRFAVIPTFPKKEVRQSMLKGGFLRKLPIYENTHGGNRHFCIYNGLEHVPWVRQTIMNGKIYVEYPSDHDEKDIVEYERQRGNFGGVIHYAPDLKPDTVPLSAKEATEGNIFRTGRFSRFDPHYLSHKGREEVTNFLNTL